MGLDIIDTHAHYDDPKFDPDREELFDALCRDENVSAVVNVGCDVPTSALCVEYTRHYPDFYAWVGIHPLDCGKVDDKEKALGEIEKMLALPKAM